MMDPIDHDEIARRNVMAFLEKLPKYQQRRIKRAARAGDAATIRAIIGKYLYFGYLPPRIQAKYGEDR